MPKRVMLTYDNVVSNTKAVLQRIAPAANDVFLSFLPRVGRGLRAAIDSN
jgi:long-chain acyl-CoA synthetase